MFDFFIGWSIFSPQSRVVGGLLSAYDLSGDKVFLDKARDIADRLLPAWNTPTGIPYNIINLSQGRAHNPGWTGVSIYLCISILLKTILLSFQVIKGPKVMKRY